MSDDRTLKSPDRRAFFTRAGAGVGAAGVVAAGLGREAAAEAAPKGKPEEGAYRETDHVRTAYRLSRF
ncbi:MAG: formate dehydrogenase [Alphaproteobacteria bacterium]|nr:formate dehydrogenase [Alphaproteobacteria bacterium]